MSKKYALPSFLTGRVTQENYLRWLGPKSIAHVRRDKKRGNATAINEAYKVAIHRAVIESNGRDQYTGEVLDAITVAKVGVEGSNSFARSKIPSSSGASLATQKSSGACRG